MYERVFQPLDIAGTTSQNRIVRTAHSWVDTTDELSAYHAARGRRSVIEGRERLPVTLERP